MEVVKFVIKRRSLREIRRESWLTGEKVRLGKIREVERVRKEEIRE